MKGLATNVVVPRRCVSRCVIRYSYYFRGRRVEPRWEMGRTVSNLINYSHSSHSSNQKKITPTLSAVTWRDNTRHTLQSITRTGTRTFTTIIEDDDDPDKGNRRDGSSSALSSTPSSSTVATTSLESKLNSIVANIQQSILSKSKRTMTIDFDNNSSSNNNNNNNNNSKQKFPTTHSTKQQQLHNDELLYLLPMTQEKAETLLDVLTNDITPEMREYMETSARSRIPIIHGAIWIIASQCLDIFHQNDATETTTGAAAIAVAARDNFYTSQTQWDDV